MIFGGRVEQVREFREFTQGELASRVGIEQVAISRIERGTLQPSESTAFAIAEVLDFPLSYFERAPIRDFALGTLDFRTRADTTAKAKKRAYQYARIVLEVAVVLSRKIRIPQLRLNKLSGDAEEAARLCRSELGLSPNAPISHLTDSLERAGVFVFSLPGLQAGCDGFSSWAVVDNKLMPAIFVSADVPGDRERLTVAHEIGELTLLDMPPGREREKYANRFAGALLMPPDAFRRDLKPPVSLHDLVEIKRQYGVAIQAALMRAFQLDVISKPRYHSLYKQISYLGWRQNEPVRVPYEKPRGLAKLAELLYGEKIDIVRLAEETALRPVFVRSILSAHASKEELKVSRAKKAQVIQFPGQREIVS